MIVNCYVFQASKLRASLREWSNGGKRPLIRVLPGNAELRDERGSRTSVGGEVTYAVNRDDPPRSRELTVRKLAGKARAAEEQGRKESYIFEYRRIVPPGRKR